MDFLGHLSGLGDYNAVASESETRNVFALDHQVRSLTGLFKSKKAAARAKDLEVIRELEAMREYRQKTGLK